MAKLLEKRKIISTPDTPYRQACGALVKNTTPIDMAKKPRGTGDRIVMYDDNDNGLQMYLSSTSSNDWQRCTFVAVLLERGPFILLLDTENDGHVDTLMLCIGDGFRPVPARLVCASGPGIAILYWDANDAACYTACVVTFLIPFDYPLGVTKPSPLVPSPRKVDEFFMELLPRKILRKRAIAAAKTARKKEKEDEVAQREKDREGGRLAREMRVSERMQEEAAEKKAYDEKRRAMIKKSRDAKAALPPKAFTCPGPSHKESPRVLKTCTDTDVAKRVTEKETNLAKIAAQKREKAKLEAQQWRVEAERIHNLFFSRFGNT